MQKPFSIMRADTCPKCKRIRCIEAFTNRGKPIGYTNILDSESDRDLRTSYISYLQCKRCKTKFFPSWHHGKPYAGIESELDTFFSEYYAVKDMDP